MADPSARRPVNPSMTRASEADAPDRTDLAEDRTLLANERTYAGWLRTGLAAIGIGVGFHALFQEMEPDWLPRALASLLLGVGIAIVVAAERRAALVLSRLDPHVIARARPMNLRIITVVVSLVGAALIVALWWLRPAA